MRLFISAGEPSGDLHASNLIAALRQRRPDAEFVGFGGERSAAAGSRLLYPLANHAVMGITQALAQLKTFFRLANEADAYFKEHRPDAVVLIDYPGFHWHVARRAHRRGIPVIWYVPPQLWAWAGWRVRRIQEHVDLVLCTLPFEVDWFRGHGVPSAQLVGHPFFDEVQERAIDTRFVHEQTSRGAPIVAILPGSRDGEIDRNGEVLLNAARKLSRARPDARFLVACFKAEHVDRMRRLAAASGEAPAQLEYHHGRTPEIVRAATMAWSVSGSVCLELMAEALPTCILYKLNPFYIGISRRVLRVPHITLVNLLAGRAVMPEFLTDRDVSDELAAQAEQWLNDPAQRQRSVQELTTLRKAVAVPGASGRAAEAILAALPSDHVLLTGPHSQVTTRSSSRTVSRPS